MKRIFDFTVSFIGLILLLPLILTISLLIKAGDKGPVFFKQMRVGKDGRLFVLYKYRSMKVTESGSDASFEPGNTSRVTQLGRFIRNTKIDEIPQLLNVLKGEMSLVGPRPEVQSWVNLCPDRWKKILTVRPGITDNASLEFRNEEDILIGSKDPETTYKEIILPRKLDLYDQYVSHHSFAGDLVLIFKTLLSLIKKTA
jgi:lipopolysaccharide/colanic/teichoic acid biosynthesis glycosyltransferase